MVTSLYFGGPGSGRHPYKVADTAPPEHKLGKLLQDAHKAWGMTNYWSRLAAHGHEGNISKFTPEERKYLSNLKAGVGACKVGFCVQNAQRLASLAENNPDLKYMEGLVTVHGVPIDHAWIEYRGKVFDPTLNNADGTPKDPTGSGKDPGHEYFGIEVPKNLIFPSQLRTERYMFISHSRDQKEQKAVWGKSLEAASEVSLEGDQKGTLWNGIRINGFTGPQEEGLRAMLSRVPPELLSNVQQIKSAKELNAKHGKFDPETKTIAFNPHNFELKQKFGKGEGSISHPELTVVHEIGHSIYSSLPPDEQQAWEQISGWMKGWQPGQSLAYQEKRPGWGDAVSEYTHKAGVKFTRHYAERNPDEDFADSFAFVMLNHGFQMEPAKKEFIDKYITAHVHKYPQVSIQSPIRATGTSEGAEKGWDERGRGRIQRALNNGQKELEKDWAQNNGKNFRERLIVFDATTGKKLLDEAGQRDRVDRSENHLDKQVVEMHTHPGNDAFSDGDWKTFAWSHIDELRVVGKDVVFSLKKTPEWEARDWQEHTPAKVNEKWNSIIDNLTSEAGKWQVNSVLYKGNLQLAKDLGASFSVTKRFDKQIKASSNKKTPNLYNNITAGGPGSGRHKEVDNEKVQRALATYKPSDHGKRVIAYAVQGKVIMALGLKNTPDHSPFDGLDSLTNPKLGVEVKAIIDQTNDKLTMHGPSLQRKFDFRDDNKMKKIYTVAVDVRGGKENIYYQKGVGSFRLGKMIPVKSFSDLKKVIK